MYRDRSVNDSAGEQKFMRSSKTRGDIKSSSISTDLEEKKLFNVASDSPYETKRIHACLYQEKRQGFTSAISGKDIWKSC